MSIFNIIIKFFTRFFSVSLIVKAIPCVVMLLCTLPAGALDSDFYAPASRLATGKWAKVEVTQSGMNFISNSMLKSLGFNDPEKVNVYGFGGRMCSESLNEAMYDDLPAIPSVRVPGGIVFFGHATVGWSYDPAGSKSFSHYSNPYSEKAFYFISDIDSQRVAPAPADDISAASSFPVTTFIERILHETDILAPAKTGRLLLGEDFRSQTSRNFSFTLPDNTGNANVLIAFGAKVSNGSSSLIISANGDRLPSTSSDKIEGVAGEQFIVIKSTVKSVENPGDKLLLSIQYSYSGALFTAALDYIEVEYPRLLRLYDNELYFYLDSDPASPVSIEGCNANTILWDVTDPVSPRTMNFELNGTTATFVTPGGYREYVAFNPEKITKSVLPAGKVNNQDLHGSDAPGMLVIAPPEYQNVALRLAKLHAETDGLDVLVVTPSQIYNEFSSGTPDVTAFRKLLKMWYDRAGGEEGAYTRYCLLFGRPSYDNKGVTPAVKRAGYPRIPIWQSPTGNNVSTSYSTDDYIGMLGDNYYSIDLTKEDIHVAVGRMPVKSVAEAEAAVNKLEKYLKNPNYGFWRNNVMLIADDQDKAQHLDQAEAVWGLLSQADARPEFIYEKLYLDSYNLVHSSQGDIYPEATARMMDKINEGVAYIDYIGHASPRGWGHEKLLTWSALTSMTNTNLPFVYAATCEFLWWDDDEISGAEEMWLNPKAGVIGMICPSRKVFISSNGTLNKNTASFLYRRGSDGKPLSMGEVMIKGKNITKDDGNKLRYAFMGDPSLPLPQAEGVVKVNSINGVMLDDIADIADAPVLQARGKMKLDGTVTDRKGNILNDFSGIVEVQIFDAEKVITTKANGTDGETREYNDRKIRLFYGKAKVDNGVWATELTLPTEIENNFSPAFISLYACDNKGGEASGASDKLFIYGYDADAPDDFDGPSITDFYINSPSFSNGMSVAPSSLLYARFADPSGINVSEGGIGHKMSVLIDEKLFYDDVALYYSPDPSSNEEGSIAYPLPDLGPGTHSLELKVWDNANNSSSASLNFNLKASMAPAISELSTDVNPASTSVVFTIGIDGVTGKLPCRLEVFDLSGRKVWVSESHNISNSGNRLNISWNLRDSGGHRVPRGIYLYRAVVCSSEGVDIARTRKLAVTAAP